jgi:branched-chain amino acid transport system permease protein
MVIGGEGILLGPLLGSGLLTMLPTMFEALSIYKTFANGALLVTFFLYLPEGMFGGLVQVLGVVKRRMRQRPTRSAFEEGRVL